MRNLVATLGLSLIMIISAMIFAVVVGLTVWLLPGSVGAFLEGSPFLAMGGGAAILLGLISFWKRAVAAHRAEAEKLGNS